VLQVPGQHRDDVERHIAVFKQREPLTDGRSQQPVRVRLVVDEGADTGELRTPGEPLQACRGIVGAVKRHPGDHAGDLLMRSRHLEHRLGVRVVVVCLDEHGRLDPGRRGALGEIREPEGAVDGGVLRSLQPLIPVPHHVPQVQMRVDHHEISVPCGSPPDVRYS
jgi:hypothetical protein